jgi:hypothetical protein
VLLGIFIERITCRCNAEYVEHELIAKLVMERSSCGRGGVLVPGRARGLHQRRHLPERGLTGPLLALCGRLALQYDGRPAYLEPRGVLWPTAEACCVEACPHGEGDPRFRPHALRVGLGCARQWAWRRHQRFRDARVVRPLEDLYKVVLINRRSDLAHTLCSKLAAAAIGKPCSLEALAVDARTLAACEAVYTDTQGSERYIRV